MRAAEKRVRHWVRVTAQTHTRATDKLNIVATQLQLILNVFSALHVHAWQQLDHANTALAQEVADFNNVVLFASDLHVDGKVCVCEAHLVAEALQQRALRHSPSERPS